MPARSRTDGQTHRSPGASASGQFGPATYAQWRATRLGTITETLERRLILRLIGDIKGEDALDIGCGDGALTLAQWQAGARRVTGCDIDARMVARAAVDASRLGAPITYVRADAERLPFIDQSFDLVSMITVLAFVRHPDRALAEVARVLRPGGHLVLGDLGKWSLWAASRRLRGWIGGGSWKAARFRTVRQLRMLVEAAGLLVEQTAGAIYYPRSELLARCLAPIDERFGGLTTVGAAFVALRARKEE